MKLDNLPTRWTAISDTICRKPQLSLALVSLKNALSLLDADQFQNVLIEPPFLTRVGSMSIQC